MKISNSENIQNHDLIEAHNQNENLSNEISNLVGYKAQLELIVEKLKQEKISIALRESAMDT